MFLIRETILHLLNRFDVALSCSYIATQKHFVMRLGYGSLGLSVEGAHRSDLEMKSKSATEYTLQYKPHEPGVYLLNIKFADEHVAGAWITWSI